MSTSNRLARAVDRGRELSKELEHRGDLSSPDAERRVAELAAAERRAVLLVAALQRFYNALAGFAMAALISLLGAVLAMAGSEQLVRGLELAAVAAGFLAVGALVHGSATLVRETRIAIAILQERAAEIQARAAR
jgi:hypothetical protein